MLLGRVCSQVREVSGPFAGRMVEVVGRHRVLEEHRTVEGEVGHMAVVVAELRTAVEDMDLAAEVRRGEPAEVEDILAVVGMGYGREVLHMAVVEAAGSPGYTGLVEEGSHLAVHNLAEEPERRRSLAVVGILVAGDLEGDIVQAAAVGILLI